MTLATVIKTLGGTLNLADPRPEDVRVEDIAYALGNQCRFGGHLRRAYHNAEHAVLVSQIVEAEHPDRPDLIEAALHHDNHKAYTNDITDPVIAMLGDEYPRMVARLNTAIAAAIGFDAALLTDPIVMAANERARAIEEAHLCEDASWDDSRPNGRRPIPPRGIRWAKGLDPETCRLLWMRRANSLRILDLNPIL